MEKVLVTGAGGFMGSHLVDLLLENGFEVFGTYYTPTTDCKSGKVNWEECDVRDAEKLKNIILKVKPKKIFHLAAQSYPTVSWENPIYTMDVNANGAINLFEAIKTARKHDPAYDPIVVVACSSAEYGFVTQDEVPVKESHSLKPLHPYGVSKVAQEQLTYQYFKNDNIKGIIARIFNTTGPRKVNDVCSDFTKRIVDIEKGINTESVLIHGNLETRRAITDVRDLIRALILLSENGKPGEVYNLSGENAHKIADIVDILKTQAHKSFALKQDPKLMRPSDEPIIMGDTTKLKKDTGWTQEIPIEKTLKDMLEFWRARLGE